MRKPPAVFKMPFEDRPGKGGRNELIEEYLQKMSPEVTALIPVFLLLAINTVSDLRTKTICLFPSVIISLFGAATELLLYRCLTGSFFSLLPGMFFLLFSLISRGGVGMGDAILLLFTGLFLPPDALFFMLIMALLLSALWAARLFMKTRKGKASFPFLPFLLAGFVISQAVM